MATVPESIMVPGPRFRCSTKGCCDGIVERRITVHAVGDFDAKHAIPAADVHAVQRLRTWRERLSEEPKNAEWENRRLADEGVIDSNFPTWTAVLGPNIEQSHGRFDVVIGTPSSSALSRRIFDALRFLGASAFAPGELFDKHGTDRRDCPGERLRKIQIASAAGRATLDAMKTWKRVLVVDDSLHDGRTIWAMIERLRQAHAAPVEVVLGCILWVRNMDF